MANNETGVDLDRFVKENATAGDETLAMVAGNLKRVMDHANQVRKAWEDKVRREGKRLWLCRFEEGDDRAAFIEDPENPKAAYEQAMAYTQEQYPMQCEVAKAEGRTFEPVLKRIWPKPTASDYYPQNKKGGPNKSLDRRPLPAGDTSRIRHRNEVQKIMGMPISLARQNLAEANNETLKEVYKTARNMGKTTLTRICRSELKGRGEKV